MKFTREQFEQNSRDDRSQSFTRVAVRALWAALAAGAGAIGFEAFEHVSATFAHVANSLPG